LITPQTLAFAVALDLDLFPNDENIQANLIADLVKDFPEPETLLDA